MKGISEDIGVGVIAMALISLVVYVIVTLLFIVTFDKPALYMVHYNDCFVRMETNNEHRVFFPNDTAKAACRMTRVGDTVTIYPIWRDK